MMPAFATSHVWFDLFWITYIAWAIQEVLIARRDRRGFDGVRDDRGSLLVVIAGIIVALTLAFALARLGAARMTLPVAVIETVALTLMVGGMALRVWAVATLGRFFRVTVTTHGDHRLVEGGPYRLLRHPGYTGTLLTIVGIALATGNWLSLLIAPLAAVAGFSWRIGVEERSLAARFGAAYGAYRTARWGLVPPMG